LIVASRPGQPLDGLKSALPKGLTLEGGWDGAAAGSEVEIRTWQLRNAVGDTAPLYLLPGLHVDVSASEIRKQVRAVLGDPGAGSDLLAGAVAEYIRAHGLYL
jgi:nicotinic acid mononucleotide adenylyltransferase